MIVYQATKIFTWFVEEMAEARRTGDADKSKALLAEVFKLLGNSGYREMVAYTGKGNAKAAGSLRYVGSATTSLNKTEKKKKFRTKGDVAQRQR